MVSGIEFPRKITFGRSTCGAGNDAVRTGHIYRRRSAEVCKVPVRFRRMNTVPFDMTRPDAQEESPTGSAC
jgi:hypothetical protein